MLKRLQKLWKLSKKDPKALKVLENLTEEQIAVIPEDTEDVKGVFISAGTEEEYVEFKREEEGTKNWYDRLKNL